MINLQALKGPEQPRRVFTSDADVFQPEDAAENTPRQALAIELRKLPGTTWARVRRRRDVLVARHITGEGLPGNTKLPIFVGSPSHLIGPEDLTPELFFEVAMLEVMQTALKESDPDQQDPGEGFYNYISLIGLCDGAYDVYSELLAFAWALNASTDEAPGEKKSVGNGKTTSPSATASIEAIPPSLPTTPPASPTSPTPAGSSLPQ